MVADDPPAIEFGRLDAHHQAIPTVARWWFDEWGSRKPGNSLDVAIDRLDASLAAVDSLTVALAFAHGRLVGTAALRDHELAERFPDL